MQKRLLLLVVSAVLTLGTATAAHAGGYPPGANTIVLSSSSGAVGSTVTVSAQVYLPGSSVTFQINPVLGTAVADANGVATLTFTVPNLTPGAKTITATGTGADGNPLTLTTTFTITGSTGGGGGTGQTPLPRTGDDSSLPLARIGLGLAAAGGIAVLAARRRRVTATA